MKQKILMWVSHLDGVESAECFCLLSTYYFAVTPPMQLILLTSLSGSFPLLLMVSVLFLRHFYILTWL